MPAKAESALVDTSADGCTLHLPPFATPAPCPQPLDALGTVLEGGVLGASDTGCARLLAVDLSFGCHRWCASILRYRPDVCSAAIAWLDRLTATSAGPVLVSPYLPAAGTWARAPPPRAASPCWSSPSPSSCTAACCRCGWG